MSTQLRILNKQTKQFLAKRRITLRCLLGSHAFVGFCCFVIIIEYFKTIKFMSSSFFMSQVYECEQLSIHEMIILFRINKMSGQDGSQKYFGHSSLKNTKSWMMPDQYFNPHHMFSWTGEKLNH